MKPTHFRDLDVWQVAMSLAKAVYVLTAEMPTSERYGLSSQLQRAAVSVPSNIAEGNARGSLREYLRFLSIASGSVAEVQTQLLLIVDLGLVAEDAVESAMALAERVSQMLYRMKQSLRSNLDDAGSRVPGSGSRIREVSEEYV